MTRRVLAPGRDSVESGGPHLIRCDDYFHTWMWEQVRTLRLELPEVALMLKDLDRGFLPHRRLTGVA